jgi:benzoate membrane transport protein
LSGVSVAGIGSAFWGVVAGAIALAAQQLGRRNRYDSAQSNLNADTTKTSVGKAIAPGGKIVPNEQQATRNAAAGKTF